MQRQESAAYRRIGITHRILRQRVRGALPLSVELPCRLRNKRGEGEPVEVLVLLEIRVGYTQKAGELLGRAGLDAFPDLRAELSRRSIGQSEWRRADGTSSVSWLNSAVLSAALKSSMVL